MFDSLTSYVCTNVPLPKHLHVGVASLSITQKCGGCFTLNYYTVIFHTHTHTQPNTDVVVGAVDGNSDFFVEDR